MTYKAFAHYIIDASARFTHHCDCDDVGFADGIVTKCMPTIIYGSLNAPTQVWKKVKEEDCIGLIHKTYLVK